MYTGPGERAAGVSETTVRSVAERFVESAFDFDPVLIERIEHYLVEDLELV